MFSLHLSWVGFKELLGYVCNALIKYGIFRAIISSNVFLLPFPPFFLNSKYVYVRPFDVLQFSDAFLFITFYSLCVFAGVISVNLT